MKFLKKHLKKILLLTTLFIVIWFFGANYAINTNADGKLFNTVSACPKVKVGLVLGTSAMNKNGYPNAYFVNRINAAVELFKAGKIEYILVSGDNGTKEYNEPSDMRDALIEAGIPAEKIYLDYAGFRTLDSMERCLKVFGQKEVIVISQQFHNERAIYLGEHFGIKCYGYNAYDVQQARGFKTKVRERFARMKVFWDILFGIDSKFLGKKVIVGN